MNQQAFQYQTITKQPKFVPFIITKVDGQKKLLSLSSTNYHQQFQRFLIDNEIDICQAYQIKKAIQSEIRRLGSIDNISISNTQKISQSTNFPKSNKINPDTNHQELSNNDNKEVSFDANEQEQSFDRYSASFAHAVTQPERQQRQQMLPFPQEFHKPPMRRQFVLLKNFKQTYSPKSTKRQFNNAVFDRLYENTTQNVENRKKGDRNIKQQLQQKQYEQILKFQQQRKKTSSSPDFFKQLYKKQTQCTKRKKHDFIQQKQQESDEQDIIIPPIKYFHSPKINTSPRSGSKCEYKQIIQEMKKQKIKQKQKQAQIRKHIAERKQIITPDRCQRHKQNSKSKQKTKKTKPTYKKTQENQKTRRKPVQCITKLLQETYQQFDKKSKLLM